MKTKSEQVFEAFLTENKIKFNKIEEATSSRPDYSVRVGHVELIFEVKELADDANFGVVADPKHPHIKTFSGTIGGHIRRAIHGSRRQIQYGAAQGIPSVLLVYNRIDPVFQLFGTDDLDFETAMYGQKTIEIQLIGRNSRKTSELFNGRDDFLQEGKNTSFSAIGRLSDRGGKSTVTLFENIYSKVKLPYDLVPSCFSVRRIEISREPLSYS